MKLHKALPDDAYASFVELRKYRNIGSYSFIQLGKALLKIRREKMYKLLGYTTFASFLADPDVAIPRQTAYLYMLVVSFYLDGEKVPEEDIVEIELTRLRDLIPIIRNGGDPAEWISKAYSLSKKDLIDEMRAYWGKEPLQEQGAIPEDEEVVVVSNYVDAVKAAPCCVCDARPVDFHHFPKTKGAGADSQRGIPLCRGCHIQMHSHPKEFLWENRVKIFDWFYRLLISDVPVEEN